MTPEDRAEAPERATRGRASHPFGLAHYPDGTAYPILSGRTGRNGRGWYVYPVCAECGARRSARVHAAEPDA